MKAIQIKYLSATNTKNARLKVWAEQTKPVQYSVESFDTNSVQSIQLQAAYKFAQSKNWLQDGKYKLEIGMLPNLDHCAVIVAK